MLASNGRPELGVIARVAEIPNQIGRATIPDDIDSWRSKFGGKMKMTLILSSLCIAVLGAWMLLPSRSPATPAQTFEQRFPNVPKDALARRARSNAVMAAQGVPINKWFPAIEAETAVRQRAAEEVTMRAVATMVVALKGEGLEQGQVDAIVRDYGLAPVITPEETAFIADPTPSQKDRSKFSWRYEAANVLLWSLGLVEDLPPPREQCDPKALVTLLQTNSRAQLLAKAHNRTMSEILDQADLIYRYRWELDDARINDKATPAGLNDDVAMERHHALNWLIGYEGQAWDNISLDT